MNSEESTISKQIYKQLKKRNLLEKDKFTNLVDLSNIKIILYTFLHLQNFNSKISIILYLKYYYDF